MTTPTMTTLDPWHQPCHYHHCPDPATEVVITLREGFCFDRCPTHALRVTLWPPRTPHDPA